MLGWLKDIIGVVCRWSVLLISGANSGYEAHQYWSHVTRCNGAVISISETTEATTVCDCSTAVRSSRWRHGTSG